MSKLSPNVDFSPTPWQLTLAGDWSAHDTPQLEPALSAMASGDGELTVDVSDVSVWDGRLSAFLVRLERAARDADRVLTLVGAPDGQRQLLKLAAAVPLHRPPTPSKHSIFSITELRSRLAGVGDGFLDSLAFLGSALSAVARAARGRSALRGRELLSSCYMAGPDALGIIALTSVLVGMILAYLGAVQLQQFGAAVYVADLVAIGMLREMGALMTAVVMAGRTGAAYAAQLSTMQSNEEIDAIRTLGIDPMEFLVAPRIIALVVMMPLLVVFADALGIVGGALVAGGLGVTPLQYVSELQTAITVGHFMVGLCKAFVFAILIAIAGCRAGMSAGRNSAAVGQATTEAVVTSVVYLIIADAAINILCQHLGI